MTPNNPIVVIGFGVTHATNVIYWQILSTGREWAQHLVTRESFTLIAAGVATATGIRGD